MATKQQQQRQQAAAPDPYEMAGTRAADAAPTGGDKSTYLRLPPGTAFFRPALGQPCRLYFLAWTCGKLCAKPYKPGDLAVVKTIHTHPMLGVNEETFICPNAMWGKRCAQCDEFLRLKKPKMPTNEWNAIKGMRPKLREVRLVHHLDGPKDNLYLWDESFYLFGEAYANLVAAKQEYRLVAHPTKGFIVNITGTKKDIPGGPGATDFSQAIILDALKTAIPKALLERARAISLDDCVVETSYDRLKKLVSGFVDDEDVKSQDSNGEVTEEIVEEPAEEEIVEEATEEEIVEEATEEVIAEPEVEEEVVEEVEEIVEEEPEPALHIGDSVTFKLSGKKTKGKIVSFKDDKTVVQVGEKKYAVKTTDVTA